MFLTVSAKESCIRNIEDRHLVKLGLDGTYKATTHEDNIYYVYGIRTVHTRTRYCCFSGPELVKVSIILAPSACASLTFPTSTIELSFRAFTALNPSKLSLDENRVGQCHSIIYGT